MLVQYIEALKAHQNGVGANEEEVMILKHQVEALQTELEHAKVNLVSYIASTNQLEAMLT